ncbi:hypothetical protein [Shigella flexneri]|uniref:hypothetical protein n=1 Tax=Shigella flexneri TaxID=623 RepID=UPI0020CE457B|nr:hypothetical protein [Shigella flexneri]
MGSRARLPWWVTMTSRSTPGAHVRKPGAAEPGFSGAEVIKLEQNYRSSGRI